MKKKTLQKITAAVMAFALIGGAVTAGNMSVFSSIMTAKAETLEGDDLDQFYNDFKRGYDKFKKRYDRKR